jgi:mono/diheme cytochrome c family protein
MKKAVTSILSVQLILVIGLFLLNLTAKGQETAKVSSALPADISMIVSVKCVPCHTSSGGFMSKGALNLSDWDKFTPGKQKNRAEKMVSMLNKNSMPPKSAKASRPEIVPTKEDIATIKKWADSLPAPDKK